MELKEFVRNMLKDNKEWNEKNNDLFFKVIIKLTISNEKMYPILNNIILPIIKLYIREYLTKGIKAKWVQQEALDCIQDSLYYALFGTLPDTETKSKTLDKLCERIEEEVLKIPESPKVDELYERYLDIKESAKFGFEDDVIIKFADDYIKRILYRNGKFIQINGERHTKDLFLDTDLVISKVLHWYPKENELYIEYFNPKGDFQYSIMNLSDFSISTSDGNTFINNRNSINIAVKAWKKLISSMVRSNYNSYRNIVNSNKDEYESFYNLGYYSDFKMVRLNNLLSKTISLAEFEKQFKAFFDGDDFVLNSPIDRGRYVMIRDFLKLISSRKTADEDLTDKIVFLMDLRDKLLLSDINMGVDIVIDMVVSKMDFCSKDLGADKAFDFKEYKDEIKVFEGIRKGAYRLYFNHGEYFL